MTPYPVHYYVQRPLRFTRVQLLIRLVAFSALGLLGLSFGAVFLAAYLVLPAFAATRLSTGSEADYVARDGRRVLGALHWLAVVSAWAGLITDRLPTTSPDETVMLQVEGTPHPTTGSALARLVTGLPSALVLTVLCWLGVLVWMWAALTVLLSERVGDRAFAYLVGVQRWSIRLLTYQASLVDPYPPFSFEDAPPPALPTARVHSEPHA